ncbi:methylaspartate mutase subunit E [Sporomusa acidovorans]|uniref:Glutamate mutase epsilon subunit n=1 Tax=Sporomusa acidovorans (strain ATCC 49682 / DSM 3132 / Mol) TaxID=1123286 RepID=A0ABZ3J0S4_SPOA4|nr:methylaspartate mutase subunit E [Sporomusa acidovorans]OZC22794.1 methylaspartate mutase E chain [Sporomusa acidovorans DSM 3132]SDE51245.1 Glutamate mutase subunit E [Sporomusa acidovorans]
MELKNKKWTHDEFNAIRQEVLAQWPTGKDVDFEEAVKYHENIPAKRHFAKRLVKAKKNGDTLTQPRAGVALIDEHINLLNFLKTEGEADLLPTTIDSYTRQNQYKEAQNGIEESLKAGRSLLNGFPAVNHGVTGVRRVVESVDAPLQVRHGTPDARLLGEITIAAGYTSYEGGGISYNIPYAKSVSLERTILDWQYCDRMVGLYAEHGIEINREPFGPLTGTLVPPSVSHAVAVIEGILAAEQGVKNITLGYGQCGNLIQDIAAIRALEQLADEYMTKHGYSDCVLTSVFHQWMGGFPQDEAKAFGVISWGAAAAALAKATKVIVKTPHEALGIPTKEANAQGLRTTKQMINMLKDQAFPLTSELQAEIDIIKAETRCILNKVFELGSGDYAVGAVRAFEAGVLDVPFAPSKFSLNKILPARDNNGAVRLFDVGNLPFTPDLIAFHRDKMAQRGQAEGRQPSFQMVIDDIYAISKGYLVGRPR